MSRWEYRGILIDYPIIRHVNNLESVMTYESTDEFHALVLNAIPAFRQAEVDLASEGRPAARIGIGDAMATMDRHRGCSGGQWPGGKRG